MSRNGYIFQGLTRAGEWLRAWESVAVETERDRDEIYAFGARGDGLTDDTTAIQEALACASFRVPVYFPTGIYSVSSSIDITRKKLIGDPPYLGGLLDYNGSSRITQAGGSVIRIGDSVPHFSGAVLFSGDRPTQDPCRHMHATPEVNVQHIQIDANFRADYCLDVYGATGASTIWQVFAQKARLDNFFFDNCGNVNLWEVGCRKAGRHGIHLRDCNATVLKNFISEASGFALPTFNSQDPFTDSNRDGCGLFIEAFCISGGVFAQDGGIQAGYWPAICAKYTGQGSFHSAAIASIANVWIENGWASDQQLRGGIVDPSWHNTHGTWRASDTIVIDRFRNLVLQKCRVTGGQDGNPDVRVIRLINGASNNIIQDNYLSADGVPDSRLGGTGRVSGDQIEIERHCVFNHLQDNISSRNVDNGVFIKFTGQTPDVPTERIHILGLRQVIAYSPSVPTSGTWRKGDIVFNTQPSVSGFVGWVCTNDNPVTWKHFGLIKP